MKNPIEIKPEGGFTIENLGIAVTTLQPALRTVIEALAQEKGTTDMTWFDELEKTLMRDAKGTITEGIAVQVEAPAMKLGIDILQATLDACRRRFGTAEEE